MTHCDPLRPYIFANMRISDGVPAGIMAPLFTNNTCGFYTSETTTCQIGNYARYAIAVQEAADIVAGVKFAAKTNVRLTIKNTGHEYVSPCPPHKTASRPLT